MGNMCCTWCVAIWLHGDQSSETAARHWQQVAPRLNAAPGGAPAATARLGDPASGQGVSAPCTLCGVVGQGGCRRRRRRCLHTQLALCRDCRGLRRGLKLQGSKLLPPMARGQMQGDTKLCEQVMQGCRCPPPPTTSACRPPAAAAWTSRRWRSSSSLESSAASPTRASTRCGECEKEEPRLELTARRRGRLSHQTRLLPVPVPLPQPARCCIGERVAGGLSLRIQQLDGARPTAAAWRAPARLLPPDAHARPPACPLTCPPCLSTCPPLLACSALRDQDQGQRVCGCRGQRPVPGGRVLGAGCWCWRLAVGGGGGARAGRPARRRGFWRARRGGGWAAAASHTARLASSPRARWCASRCTTPFTS